MKTNHPSKQISVKILKDSYNSYTDARATTFELEYPRFIHSEMLVHRVFSRNSASSRAIPIQSVIDLVRESPAIPVHFGKNQPGMQANEEIENQDAALLSWLAARDSAVSHAVVLKDIGLHKQVVNRILEPFQRMKVVLTGTEFDNFFHLRNHKDADPTIWALAENMQSIYSSSKPSVLGEGEWHLPYLDDDHGLDTEDALMVSASACAQVSYRKADFSVEKAKSIFERLIKSEPLHASPMEHQLQCVRPLEGIKGWTHKDLTGQLYSGNIRGFLQYRQLIQ